VNEPDTQRLRFLLDTVRREGEHLVQTRGRLFSTPIGSDLSERMEADPILAERVDAFGARFGRMQDTVGDRLLPALLRCLQETPGSALDNLDRAEKLDLLSSVDDWIEARKLRNRLVLEYIRDPEAFAGAVARAGELVPMLIETYDRITTYSKQRLAVSDTEWPAPLQPEPSENR
jgi:hypothetical protein